MIMVLTDESGGNNGNSDGISGNSGIGHYGLSSSGSDEEGSEPPAIVVYLVEPFTLASDSPDLQRLACVALLRAYNTVLANVPETVKTNITLQVTLTYKIIMLYKETVGARLAGIANSPPSL